MAYKFQLGTAKLSGSIEATDDGVFDLGSSGKEFNDLHIDGTANIDSLVADTADIDGGTIDGTVIGGSVVAAGSFAALVGTTATFSSTLTANGDVDLGNATSDTITATGRFDSDLVPSADGVRSLGSSTLEWANIHAKAANLDAVTATGTSNFATITASVGVSGSLIQGEMANFGGGGLSTSDGGSIQSAGDISGSGDFKMGGTVQLDGVADTLAVVSADSFFFLDATDGLVKSESMADYANLIAGNAIGASNGVLAVNVDNSTIELHAGFDRIRVKDSGITNAKLVNKTINLSAGAGLAAIGNITLGATSSIAVDGVLEDLDTLGPASADGEFIVATGAGAFAYESGATARNSLGLGTSDNVEFNQLTASHARITNLDVVTINSIVQTAETLEIADKLIIAASGSTSANSDGGGLRIGGGDGVAGHASVLYDHANTALDLNIGGTTRASVDAGGFDVVGALSASAGLLGSALTLDGTLVSSTASELNVLDAGVAGASVTVAGNDSIIIGSAASTNATTKVLVSDIATFVGSNIAETILKVDDSSAHSHVFANHGSILLADASSGAVVINLPALAAGNDGKILKIKKNGSNDVTINAAGSDLIDGLASVVLASDFAAISIIFDNAQSKYHIL